MHYDSHSWLQALCLGDIVVTVPHTFIATTEAISQAGAQIAFVDIDAATYTMDPEKLEEYFQTQCAFDGSRGKLFEKISGRPVTGVIPVHLYGQTADMDPIMELAERYGVTVIEDACQAHGAEYFSKRHGTWKKAGSMGRAAAFSFYPGKNLGACGEAGAVTTNDESMAQRMRMIRDHGQAKKYYHDIEGYNGRLDSIAGRMVLTVKLRHLARWNEARRALAHRYHELFAEANERHGDPARSRVDRRAFTIFMSSACRIEKHCRTPCRRGDWHGHSLSDSAAPAKGVPTPWL